MIHEKNFTLFLIVLSIHEGNLSYVKNTFDGFNINKFEMINNKLSFFLLQKSPEYRDIFILSSYEREKIFKKD